MFAVEVLVGGGGGLPHLLVGVHRNIRAAQRPQGVRVDAGGLERGGYVGGAVGGVVSVVGGVQQPGRFHSARPALERCWVKKKESLSWIGC